MKEVKKTPLTISIFFLFIVFSLTVFAQTQFQRAIGGTSGDGAGSIIQTTDGGYVVAGSTASFGAGLDDAYIVKLDASGTLQWSKTIGGTSWDGAGSIIQTTDGGYAVAGNTYSFGAGVCDFYIVKLDGNGTIQWSKTVGGTGWDFVSSITQTTDGGYAVAGKTNSFGAGNYDFYIMKLDTSGNLQWSRTVGGTYDDGVESIIQTTDGGYAAAGDTRSFGAGGGDMYIVKLDGSGTFQWSKTIGGTSWDGAGSIIQTIDGGYAVAGNTYSFGAGNFDIYIVKLDGSGTLQWSRTVGGTNNDEAHSIIQTADAGYVVVGQTQSFGAGGSDMYIVKLDMSGNTCGNSTTPPSISGSGGISGTGGTTTSPPSTVNTPTSLTATGGTVTTICSFVGIQPISNEIPDSYKLYQNYPNPFNPVTKITYQLPVSSSVTLTVFDINGRELIIMKNENQQAGYHEFVFDASSLASGVYLYQLTAGKFTEVKKMVLVR
jgi:hypothetical protein